MTLKLVCYRVTIQILKQRTHVFCWRLQGMQPDCGHAQWVFWISVNEELLTRQNPCLALPEGSQQCPCFPLGE